MTSKQRAYLRKLAATMTPIMQIGKSGISPELTQAVEEAFSTRELIKVAVLKNCFEEPKDLGNTLAERTRSQLVAVIGRKIILYKEAKDPKDIKIILPKA